MEYMEQVDLPGELVDYDEQQALISQLFVSKMIPLEVIRGVISSGLLTFDKLLARYEPVLIGFVDEESQALLKVLQDGAYLQQVWSWLSDTEGYKQWVHIYIENRDRLTEIARTYRTHPDYGFDLARSAQEAKNELYLAQTQPGEPEDLNYDSYTGAHDVPETDYVQVPVPGDSDYPHYLDDPEENYYHEDRGISSIPIQQAEDMELKPVEYLNLRHSDVGKMIEQIRRTAVSYRKRNYILRRDWMRLGLPCKPKYLDEAQLEHILRVRMGTGLKVITQKLTNLLDKGVPKQDVLLILMDGVYIDFLAREITIPCEGQTLQDFAINFADEVLDHAHALQDPPGWRVSDEYAYAEVIDGLDFFSQVPYDDSRVEFSTTFNRIVIENILQSASVKDAYKNAYHGYKMAQSPLGAYAYRLSRAQGLSHGQAMREFYEAAYSGGDLERPRDRVVTVHPDQLIVLTAQSNYQTQRSINAKIAAIKANQRELYIPKDAPAPLKIKLLTFLQSLHLSKPVIEGLRE
jgi:hypothetical protein